MKKVAIIGHGYVGKAVHEFLKNHYEVVVYDPQSPLPGSPTLLVEHRLQMHRPTVNACDIAFICVPTPSDENGRCDTSAISETFEWLTVPTVVLKSTVEVGTTERLQEYYSGEIVFSPEFIGESKYWSPFKFDKDMKEMPHFIFGGRNKEACQKVIDLYMKVTGPMKSYLVTDSKTAEMVKYTFNTFAAMKVTFCNEMYDICEKLGISYNEVRELFTMDPRVSKMHTAVFADERGYGGRCFPKDTKALLWLSESLGVKSEILSAVDSKNEKYRKKGEKE